MVSTLTDMAKANLQPIGKYVHLVDERNSDLGISNLVGLTIEKRYIPSVANIIGTDLSKYKIIRKGRFACSLMQVSRDKKMPVAMYDNDEPAIISPAYPMFEVNDEEELMPEYLNMYLMREEFDREAVFYAVGGVRGSLEWDDFMAMQMPIPDIKEQRRIVDEYKAIEKRIENNNRLVNALEETAQNIFLKSFPNFRDEEMKLGVLFSPHRGKNLILENCIAGNVPVIAAGKEPSAYHNQSNTDAPVITISSSGSNAGYVRLNRQKVWASDCSFIDRNQFQYIFFAYVCLKLLQEKIYSMQEGTGQPHIYPDHIKEIKICQIDNDRISEFDSQMVNIFHTIFSAQEENVKLQKVLPILLSKLS